MALFNPSSLHLSVLENGCILTFIVVRSVSFREFLPTNETFLRKFRNSSPWIGLTAVQLLALTLPHRAECMSLKQGTIWDIKNISLSLYNMRHKIELFCSFHHPTVFVGRKLHLTKKRTQHLQPFPWNPQAFGMHDFTTKFLAFDALKAIHFMPSRYANFQKAREASQKF